jgi:sigma-B regulation protein RsbU (phosphoserine phosphatase)
MSLTLLIIDDDQIIRMQMRRILEKAGHSVIEAENGKKGADLAESEKPNAIFLDRNMPVMDGNTTLIKLKNTAETQHIPVIMLTGDSKLSDVETSLDLGACDYIVKPFGRDTPLSSLNKAMEKP